MPKKRVTKIDPKEKLARYLDHQSSQDNKKYHAKVSASLSRLHGERKSALAKRLGLIVTTSLIILICLGYYISPLANVASIKVEGGSDLPLKEVVQYSGIKAQDKVIDYMIDSGAVNRRLTGKYSEIKDVTVQVNHLNQLVLKINEYQTIGYIKQDGGYCKILSRGKLGTQLLPWSKVSPDKPVFVGYNHVVSLKKSLQLFNSLPRDFQSQIKLLSGNTRRKSQVVFLMKDGNVVIGNLYTMKNRLQSYEKIKAKVAKNSLIDLEVGAFSRPLTTNEKRTYGLK